MSNYLVTDTELASVANAIRTKGGTAAQLSFPTGFVSAIDNISAAQPLPFVIRPDAEITYTISADRMVRLDDGITIPAYSTSSQTVLAGTSTTIASSYFDLNTYDYFVLVRCVTIPVYNTLTPSKARPAYALYCACVEIVNIPANTYKAKNGNLQDVAYASRNNTCVKLVRPMLVYWSSASAISVASTSSYGIAQSNGDFTLSSATAASPSLTFTTPTVTMRGSSTYFNSTNWGDISDINYKYKIELYRSPKTNSTQGWALSQILKNLAPIGTNGGTIT